MKFIKRIKWAGWMLIIPLVLTGIYFFYPSQAEYVIGNHQMINSSGTIKYDHISNYPGLNLRLETEETDKYTMSISIPTVDVQEIDIPIQLWIQQQIESFKKSLKQYGDSLVDGHLNIQLNTSKYSDNIYSLVFHSYKFTGGANGVQTVKPFVIDMESGKILHITDIIDIHDKALSENLEQHIRDELNKIESLESYLMPDLVDEVLQNIDELKWSIDKQSLFIYFDEYEIAAGAAGDIEVQIPLVAVDREEYDLVMKEPAKLERDENQSDGQTEENEEHEEGEKEMNENKKYIALTFDDGPSPDVTPRVLETLEKFDIRATFFMLGSQVEYYPAIAKEVADAGHELASHSYNHPDLTKLNYEQMKREFDATSEQIKKATGIKPNLFRPPYGAVNNSVINFAENNGYSIILWSVDSLDWKSRNATAIYDLVLDTATDGAIILLHDIHPTTADSLPKMITTLKDQGYEFVTVSEILTKLENTGVGPHRGNYK